MTGHRRRKHGRLFWRVYLHGLLLLVIVAVTVAAVSVVLRRGQPGLHTGRVAAYAAGRIAELAGTPERLREELERLREGFGVDATLYGPGGAVLATSVEPPLAAPPPGREPRAGAVHLEGRGMGWAVPLPEVRGVLVLSGDLHGRDPHRALLFIGAVLAALALASFPLARSIAAPVERLTAAARALGAGDLGARANVRAKGELGELGGAFDDMAARLQRLLESQRELLANVSHELRTPLARIRVALELAAEGDPERARRHLEGIAGDLSELEALIEDVLTAARLDVRGAGLPFTPAPVELGALVGEVAARFREAHPGRELVVEAGPAPAVSGDAALLRRLLANLLDNAAKYSEPPAPVTLALRAEAGAAVLEIRDLGIGVDPADLPRLFTPFFRTDRSRARGTGGTGLGLALAKRIAEAHGGSIVAESAPGEGTTFRVRVPGR